MLEKFQNHITKNLPFLNQSKLLIAISGGLDSVILMHLCHQLELDISLAHCNFNLRGEESDTDEVFVTQLAEDLNVEVFVQKFDTYGYAKENKLSIQMAARELRYNWFNDLIEQLNFDYVLTAHHADDNLETFLINLSRGTGLEGLTGIPEINSNIARPLLPFSRGAIEVYAKENDIAWREDASNASTKYLRNKLRHEVIPILKGINPQLLQNFNKTQKYLKDSQQVIEDRIDVISNDVIDSVSENGIHFNIKKILELNYSKAYLYELLKDYGFSEWEDIYHLLEAQSGKQIFSKTHRLLKDREVLILTEINFEKIKNIIVSETDKIIETPIGFLSIETVNNYKQGNNNVIYIDKDKIKFPLVVRQWEEGDYFHPLGMKGKKKLSKYFKDEKLSLIDKENTWLLSSNDAVVWVLGRRQDDRFKVISSTKSILKLKVKLG